MYGIEEKLIAITISAILLLQSYGIRLYVGTYLCPAALFPLLWFIYTIFPLVILFDVPINPLSIAYIWLCVTSFSLSVFLFDWNFAIKRNRALKNKLNPHFGSNFMKRCLYLSSLLAVIFSTWTMIINGWSIKEIFFDFLETSGRFAAIRGNVGMEYGAIGTLSTSMTYLSPVLGGFVSSSKNTKVGKPYIFAIALAPAVFTMVIQSSKLVFLVATSFYFASTLLTKAHKSNLAVFQAASIYKLLILVPLLSPFVLISFLSREGYSDFSDLNETINLLKYALSSYLLGQIYAFSDFFSFSLGMPAISVYNDDFYSFGAYTFTSIFETLGIHKSFSPGTYDETGFFPEVFETNIFTIFRGLIYDFGIPGSIIIMFPIGLIANAFFYKVLALRKPWAAASIYISTIVFIVMTYLISAFMARYLFMNAILVYLVLIINSLVNDKSRTTSNLKPSELLV